MKFKKYAFILAFGYLLFSLLYICSSGIIALNFANLEQSLGQIEQFKGIIFVSFTAILLYFVTAFLISRIEKKNQENLYQKNLLLVAEARALAGVYVLSVAHDCNNVITSLSARIEKLLNKPLAELKKEDLLTLHVSVFKLQDVIRRFQNATGKNNIGERQYGDLSSLVKEAVELVQHHQSLRDCQIDMDFPAQPIFTYYYSALISQMVSNLLINAGEAIQSKTGNGQIRLKMSSDEHTLSIEVHDNGTGVPYEIRHKIFDSFYSTKKDGTGLGLLSVKACVDQEDGAIEVTDSPLGGACFKVVLPKISEKRTDLGPSA